MPVIFFLILVSMASTYGFQSSLTESGLDLRWTIGSIPLKIVNNSRKISKLETERIIKDSLLEWNSSVSTAKIIPSLVGNNQIRFESDFSEYGPAVVGITELKYGPNGIISGGIIRINEENYSLGINPVSESWDDIFLGDVVSHELGHFLGLSHSEVIDSTMFYATFPGQSLISEDDIAGFQSKYSSDLGRIYGYVKGGNGAGILGVHVQAISSSSGELISTFSDETGYFEIAGLSLNNSYYLYTSPSKNIKTLPTYFQNTQTDFCPASYVGSFFSSCGKEFDGVPSRISLTTSSKSFNAGVVSINCALRTQEDYNFEKVQSYFSRLKIYSFGDESEYEKSYVGYFRTSELVTTSFSPKERFEIDLRDLVTHNNQKYLRIQIISQPFGNPVEYSMEARMNGGTVTGSPFQKENTQVQTYHLDSYALIPLSTNSNSNIFEIDISAKKLSEIDLEKSIPSFSLFGSEKYWPYLLLISVWNEGSSKPILNTPPIQSDNVACLDAPFTYSVEEAKTTVSGEEFQERRDDHPVVAACGTIDPPSSSGPMNYLVIMALGFLLSLTSSKLFKNKKNILS